MRKIVSWYFKLSVFPRLALSSLCTAFPFYFAQYISYLITETLKISNNKFLIVVVHAVIFIVLLTVVIFIYRLFMFYHEQIYRETEKYKENLLHAYTLCDRQISDSIRKVNSFDGSDQAFFTDFIASCATIQSIVDALYHALESEYGKEFSDNQRIDFEVTFMTKSYKDGKITIPASANKVGRSPHSMLKRELNPNTYENTMTNKLYSSNRPDPIIIEDTEDIKAGYEEVYPGQKKRIKSSIIYPILSDKNELLGTLVVHCDKSSFFKWNKIKSWSDLLEIFSKKIALEKIKMDKFYQGKCAFPLTCKLVKPF